MHPFTHQSFAIDFSGVLDARGEIHHALQSYARLIERAMPALPGPAMAAVRLRYTSA
jgi:hypothetical protein